MRDNEQQVEKVDRPLWFERNEHGRLEELRRGDEPGPDIVLLTPLAFHHVQALLGALRDNGEDDDLPTAHQLLLDAARKLTEEMADV